MADMSKQCSISVEEMEQSTSTTHKNTRTAEQSGSSVDPTTGSSIEKSFLPDFEDVNGYSKAALRCLLLATKRANELPSNGDDFDYYSSFDSFRRLMDIEGDRILHIIQQVMRYHGAKGNLSTNDDVVETEDKFDVLVDANDQLLERVGTLLDETAGLKKEAPLVVATVTPRQSPIASWNKKVTPKSDDSGLKYRLLAARNIQRPQLKFKDKIDNSLRPFQPKIKEKYNALKPLAESLVCDIMDGTLNEDDSLCYPHPYQFELDHFTPDDSMLTAVQPQKPNDIRLSSETYIDSVEKLERLVRTLKAEDEIAVDLEHHSYRSFLGITCLMQISTRSSDFIVDTLQLRSELHILNDVFTDPGIVKVFHGADMDVQWLQRDFGLYLVNLFDTGQAARVLGLARYSLAFLLHAYCGVDADKQYQLADWRIRPLPAELLKYAREDTHYLLYIYDVLRNTLIERGNNQTNLLQSVLQRSKDVCAKTYEKPSLRDDSHLELYRRSRKHFNSRQLSALKALYEWRHMKAQTEDESTGYVLPNHMMLQMSDVLPREPQGIIACCNPVPPLVKQNLGELHALVKRARDTALVKASPVSKVIRPTPQQHPKYSVDNLLHCPHDLSHQADSVSSNSIPPARTLCDSLIKSTAIISALVTKPTHKLSESEWKAIAIKAMFRNPFVKYLPAKNQPVVASVSSKAALQIQVDAPASSSKWKLLPNTPKPAPPTAKPVATSTPAASKSTSKEIVTFEISDDEDAIPVREQMSLGSKKRPRTTGPIDLDPLIPAHLFKAPKLKSSPVQTTWQPIPDDTEIETYDYSQADLSFLQAGGSGGKKKKFRKEYNPDRQMREPRFKGRPKPRMKPGSGKKSLTSQAGQQNSPRIQWPRR